MKVSIRSPAIQVLLIKNVARNTLDGLIPVATRFSGATPSIDITGYFGEHDSVRVAKSVREPAGSFSFTITQQLYYDGKNNFGDSLYGLIEPMDSIVIRMTGNSYKQNANGVTNIPIMMRGFVSRVRYAETVDGDGKPQRIITVSGQDFGKILQMIQIFYMPGVPGDANYMTTFPFFSQFGIGNNIQPASSFFKQVFDEVVNPYISLLGAQTQNQTYLPHIATDILVDSGQVSPYGTGGFQNGSIYELIKSFGDIGPWNEFFIEDREDAPYAVYRPNPFNTVSGTPIFNFPSGKFPASTIIGREDIVFIDGERTDENVANYFWVDSPRFNLNYDGAIKAFAVQASLPGQSPYQTNYQNVDPTLYGTKKMWEQTQQGGDGEVDNGNGSPVGDARNASKTNFIDWMTQRRIDLIAQNRDNVIFERGNMQLKGNEKIRAGTYISYNHGAMTSLYYAHSVDHTYRPFSGNYMTGVNYERGTNFIDRIQRNANRDSPYLDEMQDIS